MDIKHRISFNSINDAEFLSAVIEMGIDQKAIELPGGGGKFVTFVISESDPHWVRVAELVATRRAVNLVETIFTAEEIRNAEWSRLVSTFEQGYPQPKLHWPLKQLSYDIICPKCAIYRQTHPMRLAKEPNLGRKSFMSSSGLVRSFVHGK